MKRDIDLIRLILLEIEALPVEQYVWETDHADIAGYSSPEIENHFQLLEDAGFLKDATGELSGNSFCQGLSWDGHEFLDSIRSASVWSKVKSKLAVVGGSVGFETIKAVAEKVVKSELGLG